MPGAKRSDEKGSEMVSAESRTPKARCSKMLRVNLVRVRVGVRVRARVSVWVRVRVIDVARAPGYGYG